MTLPRHELSQLAPLRGMHMEWLKPKMSHPVEADPPAPVKLMDNCSLDQQPQERPWAWTIQLSHFWTTDPQKNCDTINISYAAPGRDHLMFFYPVVPDHESNGRYSPWPHLLPSPTLFGFHFLCYCTLLPKNLPPGTTGRTSSNLDKFILHRR